MRNLTRRYVTVEQRKSENQGITEDDINEVKQDISAFRFELLEILKQSGMNVSSAAGRGPGALTRGNILLRKNQEFLISSFSFQFYHCWLHVWQLSYHFSSGFCFLFYLDIVVVVFSVICIVVFFRNESGCFPVSEGKMNYRI